MASRHRVDGLDVGSFHALRPLLNADTCLYVKPDVHYRSSPTESGGERRGGEEERRRGGEAERRRVPVVSVKDLIPPPVSRGLQRIAALSLLQLKLKLHSSCSFISAVVPVPSHFFVKVRWDEKLVGLCQSF